MVPSESEQPPKRAHRDRPVRSLPRQSDVGAPRLTAQTSRISKPTAYSARRIKSLRNQLGTSQAVFADLLGVSKSLVEHWEAGVRTPSMLARRLMDSISADPATFLEGLSSRHETRGDA
jgi:putative transcriptional regulator